MRGKSRSPKAKTTALAIQIPAAGVSVPCRASPAPMTDIK